MNRDTETNHDSLETWLAAFLANKLDSRSRADLMMVLSESPEARELFAMAFELYKANAETGRERARPTGRLPNDPSRENPAR